MVAKNHCLMKLRDKHGRLMVEINEKLVAPPEVDNDKHLLLENEKTLDLMTDALKELNPEQQQCVTLFYLQKKSYQEISRITGYSMMQVKSYIQNGKRNLRLLVERRLM